MDIVKKTVDFIPQVDLSGDFTKYSDRSIARMNSRVASLMNILQMEQGTHPEYPDMGAKNILLELYNSERVRGTAAIHEIESMSKKFLNLDVAIEYTMNKQNPELVELSLTVNSLPGKVRFDVVNRSQEIRIMNPKLIQ